MNPFKRHLCHMITDIKEDLSCSKCELEFLEGYEVGRKSWRYARLSVHIELLNLRIEVLKALGGV